LSLISSFIYSSYGRLEFDAERKSKQWKIGWYKSFKALKILHILFVDDVVIMTNANMQEWWEIDKILKSFCLASGLSINASKSTFHQAGLSDQEMLPYKALFPYTFIELEQGFKYLGFYIKAGYQRKEEWSWLIKRVEKKISNWCYRWLSLGGRFTLLKVVLESQPIYWLSLAVVPISVLNSLRKLMYNFLWHRTNESNHFHLCRWDHIALPKSFGGWGIRNILTSVFH
jgi:hypothetical protein